MLIKRSINVGNHGYGVELPGACPICHHHSEFGFTGAESINQDSGVQAIFKCAYAGCRQFFFCYYGPLGSGGKLEAVRPVKPSPSAFSDEVKKLSPQFVQIFNEAEEAAHNGLSQIAGPGYRRAFEFLIKDYAKSLAPDKAKEIESKFSGAVVNEYVPDTRIQGVAKRVLWLGNDETHYLKKWTEHDIDDLVKLVRLAAHWIDIETLSKSYEKSMPD